MKTIMGIDPGLSGALSFYDGYELIVYDMPTHEISVGGKKRNHLDVLGLRQIIIDQRPDHAFIERVHALPGNGTVSSFSYGYGIGIIDAVVMCCGVPFTHVTPQAWKKAMGCPADKDGARQRASQLMPQFAHNWPLKKHDGRAESALIALYGSQR